MVEYYKRDGTALYPKKKGGGKLLIRIGIKAKKEITSLMIFHANHLK